MCKYSYFVFRITELFILFNELSDNQKDNCVINTANR